MMDGEGLQASTRGDPSHYLSLEPPLSLSLDSLQYSDSDSLNQELEYQSALQRKISQHEDSEGTLEPDTHSDHTGPSHRTKQTDRRDSRESSDPSDRRDPSDRALQRVFIQGQRTDTGDTSLEGNEEEYNNPSFQKWDTSYSDLLYDPDWKRKRGSGATASSQDLEDFSDDSLSGYCTSPDKATLKTLQNRAGSADKQSAGSTNTTTTRQNKPPADPVYRTRDVNSVTGSKRQKKGSAQSQNSQKDILEKNKHTLGVRGPRTHSYLQLHQKNADKDTSGQDQKKLDLPSVKKVSGHMVTNRPIEMESAACVGSEDTERSDTDTECSTDTSRGDVSGPPGHHGLVAGFISTHRVGGNPPGVLSAGPMGMNFGFEVPPPSYSRLRENLVYSFKSQAVQDTGGHSCSRPLHVDLWDVLAPPRQPHHVAGLQSAAALDQTAGARGQMFYSRALSPVLYEASDYLYIDAESVGHEQTSSTGTEPDQHQINGRPHMDKAQRQKVLNFLKQEVKLGGIGPSYSLSTERTEQLQKQKVYTKLVQERNRELKPAVPKVPDIPIRPNDDKKCVRQKGLEYAMKVPKPHTLPKISAPCRKDETPPPPAYLQDAAPQLQRIHELQRRHELEKVAVAAFNAFHIL